MGLREQSERKAPEKYFTKISLNYAKPLTYKLGSKSLSILYQKVICEWNWSLTGHIFQTSNFRHTYCLRASQTEIKEQWHCTQPSGFFHQFGTGALSVGKNRKIGTGTEFRPQIRPPKNTATQTSFWTILDPRLS